MSALMEGAQTRTEIRPVTFTDAGKAAGEVQQLLETTTGAEVHLAFLPQEGEGWQVQGLIIHNPQPAAGLAVVEALPEEQA